MKLLTSTTKAHSFIFHTNSFRVLMSVCQLLNIVIPFWVFVNLKLNILRKNLIPNRISEICKAKNLNVKELAVEVGMAYSTFHNYASGRSEPKLDFFACMYDYDINLDWLITGEGQMFRGQSGTNQTVVTYGKGSTVVSTGVNHGHIVAEGKNTYVESRDGRAAVICDFVRAFASEHGADDVVWLEKQLERAVPEFRDWKEGK